MLPLSQGTVWQFFFLIWILLLIDETQSEGRVVCYYTNWSVYRPGTAKFNPQNINPYLCTHLIYAFGGFTKDNTLKPFDKYQDIEQGGYSKFTGLKSYNKNLKTLIAIGGWNEASSRFSPLVANPERRQQFIKNILKFLRQNHFDGLDLDWEYPSHRDGGKPRDKDNYAKFVEELRNEFERESSKTGRPRLLITMAVPAGIEYIEKGYDVPKLNKYLDWFNILSYDYHSAYEPSVNHHAPLYSLEEESEYNYDSELNIDYTVKYYLTAGADKDKLVLGIPTYGRSYTLINEESSEIGAPSDGPGEQGDATREKGYLAYYEICQNLREDPEWHVMQPNPKAMGPYAYKNNQWVGYDDEAIVRKKGEYVANNGLGGIMFWSIDNDDFRGLCTGKPYPLIEAAKEAFLDSLRLDSNEISKSSNSKKPLRSRSRQNSTNLNKISTSISVKKDAEKVSKKDQTRRPVINRKRTTTQTPISLTSSTSSSLYIGGRTTTPEPPTTPDPGSDFKCEEEGFFQHPRDCKKYFWCLDSGPSNLGIVAHQFTCPSGLYFNPAADSCDFSRNVLCNNKPAKNSSKTTTTTTTTKPQSTTIATTNRPKLTAATSRNSFKIFSSTTTTTEPAYEYEDDDEVEEEKETYHNKENDDIESEEDPKVIKELIDLIKKVGGIEELEKILHHDGDIISFKTAKSSGTATTESTITKTLYDKVLRRPGSLRSFQNQFNSVKFDANIKKSDNTDKQTEISKTDNKENKYSSVFHNSRQNPQNDGIEKLSEFSGLRKEKPKYVTITRTTPSVTNEENISDEVIDHEIINNDDDIPETPKTSSTPSYKTVQRLRPITYYNKSKDITEEIVKTEKKHFNKTENKNRYNEEHSIDTNFPAQVNVLSSPVSVDIIQRAKIFTKQETSTINYETKEEDLSAQTVHMDYKKNTTLSPTKANIFTPRVYSNFSRTTTSPQPIKISIENTKTTQESISNSLNTTTLTPISFPLTTEAIYTTANDIPTINTTPEALINPLNNSSESNTTFLPILLNITEVIGTDAQVNETTETENTFDETETKANTTDKVLLTKSNKDLKLNKTLHYSSSNISVENSNTNNINNNLKNGTIENNSIKLNKTQKAKTNLDIDRTGELQTITESRPKSFDFRQRRPKPTPHKTSTIPNFVISDSLSSTENEISSKEVSFFSPFNHKSKNISRNATVDLNSHSIVDSTRVKADIKNIKLASSLKPAPISHRKILGNNNNVIESVETRSMISKRYSWRDSRIGNYRPWHNKSIETDDSDEITNTESKQRVYIPKETHNSNIQHLRKINENHYGNRAEEDKTFTKSNSKYNSSTKFHSTENKDLKESSELKERENNSYFNENNNFTRYRHDKTTDTPINLDYQNTTTYLKHLNNSSNNNSLSTSHKYRNQNNNSTKKLSENKNYQRENIKNNNTQNINSISKRQNSTQNKISIDQHKLNTENVDFNQSISNNFDINSSTELYNENINATNTRNTPKNNTFKNYSQNEKAYNHSLITESDHISSNINGSNKYSLKYSSINRHRLQTNTESSDDDLTTISDIKQMVLDSGSTKINYAKNNNNDSTLTPTLKRLRPTITAGKTKIDSSTEYNILDKVMYNNFTTGYAEISNSSSSTNDINSRKNSTRNRFRLKHTTKSINEDLQILDQTQDNPSYSSTKTPHVESKYNDITLIRVRSKTTTDATDNDFASTESNMPDKILMTESTEIVNNDSIINNTNSQNYTIGNEINSTTKSISENLTILNQTRENFTRSSVKLPHIESSYNSTLLKITTETPYNYADSTANTDTDTDTEEYNKSLTTESGKIGISDTTTNSTSSGKHSAVSRLTLRTTTESTNDDLDILGQTQKSLDSDSLKLKNSRLKYSQGTHNQTFNRLRFQTTTESSENEFVSTENNVFDKEGYNNNSTTESDKIFSSSTNGNNSNSRIYSSINRLRLKTTTSVSDNLNILGQTQNTLDSNSMKNSTFKYSEETQNTTFNRLGLETMEMSKNNITGTNNNFEEKVGQNNSYTTEFVENSSTSKGSNNINARKYTDLNRFRLKPTAEFTEDDLTILNQTQKKIGSSSVKLLNNNTTNNESIWLKTTTATPVNDFASTVHDFNDEEEYFTTESAGIGINSTTNNNILKSTIESGINKLKTFNQTQEQLSSNTEKLLNDNTKYNDSTLNRVRFKSTTETPDNDFAITENDDIDKEEYNIDFTTEPAKIRISNTNANKQNSRKFSNLNRFRSTIGSDNLTILEHSQRNSMSATTKSSSINRIELKTTTEKILDNDPTSTEDSISYKDENIFRKNSRLNQMRIQTRDKSRLYDSTSEKGEILNTNNFRLRNSQVQNHFIETESLEDKTIKTYSWKDSRIGNFRPWHTTIKSVVYEDDEEKTRKEYQNSNVYKILHDEVKENSTKYDSEKNVINPTKRLDVLVRRNKINKNISRTAPKLKSPNLLLSSKEKTESLSNLNDQVNFSSTILKTKNETLIKHQLNTSIDSTLDIHNRAHIGNETKNFKLLQPPEKEKEFYNIKNYKNISISEQGNLQESIKQSENLTNYINKRLQNSTHIRKTLSSKENSSGIIVPNENLLFNNNNSTSFVKTNSLENNITNISVPSFLTTPIYPLFNRYRKKNSSLQNDAKTQKQISSNSANILNVIFETNNYTNDLNRNILEHTQSSNTSQLLLNDLSRTNNVTNFRRGRLLHSNLNHLNDVSKKTILVTKTPDDSVINVAEIPNDNPKTADLNISVQTQETIASKQTTESELTSTEDYFPDKDRSNNYSTTEPSEVLNSSIDSNNTNFGKYSNINRLRLNYLKTTTETASEDSDILDTTEKSSDSNSLKLQSVRLKYNEPRNNGITNKLRLRTTTEIPENDFTEDNITNNENSSNSTLQSAEILSRNKANNSTKSRKYTAINRLRLKSQSDDLDISEQTQETIASKHRFLNKATTDTSESELTSTEDYLLDKEGNSNYSTTEPSEAPNSSIDSNNTNYRKYSNINRLRLNYLKTTTETASEDSDILDTTEKSSDSNSLKLQSVRLKYNEPRKNTISNKLWLRTTTEIPENDFTEDNITNNDNSSNSTSQSAEILSKNKANNSTNSRKYTAINRLRLKSQSDVLDISDQTQETIASKHRLLNKATTDTSESELTSAEEYLLDKEGNSNYSTTEPSEAQNSSIDSNNTNYRKYSNINRLRLNYLKTTTETASEDSDILDTTEKSSDSNSLKLQSVRLKYNEPRNNGITNKLRLRTTTEIPENDFTEDYITNNENSSNSTSQSAEILSKNKANNSTNSRKYTAINRLRLKSQSDDLDISEQTQETIASKHRFLNKATTDTSESELTSTEDYLLDKEGNSNYSTTEPSEAPNSSIDSNNTNYRKYSNINRLRLNYLKTTTETASEDSDILDTTEKSSDSNSLKLQSVRLKYNEARKNIISNKLRLRATTEIPENDFTEDNITNNENSSNSTSQSAEILSKNKVNNSTNSRKYTAINRLRLKSQSDDLDISDQTQETIASKHRFLNKATTDTSESELTSTEEYLLDKEGNSNYSTTEPSEALNSNNTNDRKYSNINRLRLNYLKTTTETASEDSDILDTTEKSSDSNSLKLQSVRLKYNEARKNIISNKLRLRATTEIPENDFTEDYITNNENSSNSTSQSAEILNKNKANNSTNSRKYVAINRLRSQSDDLDISDQTQETIASKHRLLNKGTTDTSESELTSTEDYLLDKEGNSNYSTTEPSEALNSNNTNFRKYSNINRLRLNYLKTTTETASEDSDILDTTEKSSDSNSLKLQSVRLKYNEARKNIISNKLRLRATTEIPENDFTEDNITNNENSSNSTSQSAENLSKNKVNNSTNSRKYTAINRLRLKSQSDDLDISDQTQETIASKHRFLNKATTDTSESELTSTEEYLLDKEGNSNYSTTEPSEALNSNNTNDRKYSNINRLRLNYLKTTTETASEDSDILDTTEKSSDSNSLKLQSVRLKYNEPRNNGITNKLRLRTTTEIPENDFTEDYITNNENSSNSTSQSAEILSKNKVNNSTNSRKYTAINRLRLKSQSDDLDISDQTQETIASKDRLLNKATTDISESELTSTEDYFPDRDRSNKYSTTEPSEVLNSSIDSNNTNFRKYSNINRLRLNYLKTTTETASEDSDILDTTEKSSDSNSLKLQSVRLKYNEPRNNGITNKLRLRTTTEIPENDFTEDNITNNENSSNSTSQSAEILSKNKANNSTNSRKYTAINRLRLKSQSDDLDISDQTQETIASKDRLLNKATTDISESELTSTEDYFGNKDGNNNYSTSEPSKVPNSSIGSKNTNYRKYSNINRLRLKTTTETASEDSDILDKSQETLDSNSLKLENARLKYNEARKNIISNKLRLRTTTETLEDDFNEDYITDNDSNSSNSTSQPAEILSKNKANNSTNSRKYAPINRLRLKSQSNDLDISDQTQETIDSNSVSSRLKYNKTNNQVYSKNSDKITNNKTVNINLNKHLFNGRKTNTKSLNDNNSSVDNQNITANKNIKATIDSLDNNYNEEYTDDKTEFNDNQITNGSKTNLTSNNDTYAKLNRFKISADIETNNSAIISDKVQILENITQSIDSFDNNTMRLYKNNNRSEDIDIHFSNITNPHLNLLKIEKVESNTNNITFDKDSGINIEYLNGFKDNITESTIQHLNNIRRFQKGNISSPKYKEKDVNITNEFHSTTSDGRRLRILKLKRPIFNSIPNNTFTPVNRTLLTNEFTNDNTKTQTELGGARNFTRKIIRKRPVAPSSTTEDNVTQNTTAGKYIRRIIKKIKRPQTNINETTTNTSNISTGLSQEDNLIVTSKIDDNESLTSENLYNNSKTSTKTSNEKTFVSRRLYRPSISPKVNKTTEKTTSENYTRKVNRNYFGLKTTTERSNNISTNKDFNILKVDNKIPSTQTFKNKLTDNYEVKEDYDEEDDEENVDTEYNDDESDDEENDNDEGNDNNENQDNDERRTNINFNSLITSTSKPRNSKIRNNFFADKRKNSTPNSLAKLGNNRGNFPTNLNNINQNKQPYNVLGKIPSKRPRVINRPIFTTPYPSQNQIEITNFSPPTTPSIFRSTNTRTYERKYFPSSTENSPQEIPQDNPLLEELNIDALNARNKKIFEITSKKHTTSKPKPLLTEQQSTMEKNTTSESDTQYNTPSNIYDYTEITNLNHSQDALIEHTTMQLSPENSTTNTEITTLKHIFAIDEDDEPTTMRVEPIESYHSEDEGKIVEINRVIEISSQEQKRKQKSKNISALNDAYKANTDLIIESPSHVDKLGEISRVKLVKLVENNTTDTDYLSTVLYDKNNKKSYIKKERQLILPEVIRAVETSTISLEGLFDSARKSKKLELINGPVFASSLGEIYSKKSDTETILTTTEDSIKSIPTTQSIEMIPMKVEENSTTIVEGTTATERNYNYVRPIVPLLRPESNESSPLVISIANLDKVILSKISKTDSNVADSAPVSQVVEAPKFLKHNTLVNNFNHSSQGRANIIEETLTSFSSQTSIVRKKQPRKKHKN